MVPLNFTLRLTLMLLVSVPFTILFLLMPFLLLLPLGRVGCETLGEAVKGFKSLIWSTKEGKRIVVFMIIVETIMYLLVSLIYPSLLYMIHLDSGPRSVLMTFSIIAAFTLVLFIMPHYQRILDQKLQVKQDDVKPKD